MPLALSRTLLPRFTKRRENLPSLTIPCSRCPLQSLLINQDRSLVSHRLRTERIQPVVADPAQYRFLQRSSHPSCLKTTVFNSWDQITKWQEIPEALRIQIPLPNPSRFAPWIMSCNHNWQFAEHFPPVYLWPCTSWPAAIPQWNKLDWSLSWGTGNIEHEN